MHPQLRAWAQLVRVPNTLTACADVLAGFTLAAGAWWQITGIVPSIVVAAIASICLYWAGMVLNDVHDLAEDIAQGRNGPLVRGLIAVGTARTAGWALLLAGVALAGFSAYLLPVAGSAAPYWIVAGTATALAVVIVAYDSWLKATPLGPLLMGTCRGLNLLVGVSLGACVDWQAGLDWSSIVLATMGLLMFVTGITLAARREGHSQQSTYRLAWSWAVSALGVGAIALSSVGALDRPLRLDPKSWFPILVAMLAMPWLRRAFTSIHSPGVGTLVPAIKQAILSIIFLDAAIALQFGGYWPGIIVCCLSIPTFALSRIFRVT
jgi:4-hydroxybenzoate polyprenyltransferase